MNEITRRDAMFTGCLAVGTACVDPINQIEEKYIVDDNPGLPIVEFDKCGKISNLKELFAGRDFQARFDGYASKEILVWVPESQKVTGDFYQHPYEQAWGEMELKLQKYDYHSAGKSYRYMFDYCMDEEGNITTKIDRNILRFQCVSLAKKDFHDVLESKDGST